jgi:hypothetical protein
VRKLKEDWDATHIQAISSGWSIQNQTQMRDQVWHLASRRMYIPILDQVTGQLLDPIWDRITKINKKGTKQ